MGTKLTYLFSMVLILAAVGAVQADLVSQWTFEEGAGTQVNDVVGGNHGTVSDTPTWIAGVYGGAMEFAGSGSADGTGYRVDCGNDASLDIGSEISLALWIRPDAEDPEGGMETAPMCKALSSASPSWSFQVRYGWGGPQPFMAFTFNTSPRAWAFVGKNMEQGEWQHIACTHDGTTLTCYLNGEETESTPMGAVTNSPAPVLIGSDGWGSDWIGGIDDVRYYNNFLTAEEIVDVMLDGAGPEVADDPVPENEAIDVSRDVTLGWSAGEFADTHDVYLGMVFDDVNDASRTDPMDVLVSQGQSDLAYDPGRLEFGQTYYWRVDEVNAAPDNTIFKGEVWSFATEPLAYPIEGVVATSNAISEADAGPENVVNGSGLDDLGQHSTDAPDMWLGTPSGDDPVWIQFEFDSVYKLHEMQVWNYNIQFEMILGFGLKDVTVEYSNDGVEWMALGDVELAQATASPDYAGNAMVDLQGVAARYVRLTVNSGWGAMGQYGLSEVRFLAIPVLARVPQPANGATGVDINGALVWRAGREAATHEVYLDSDAAAVADGTALVDTLAQSSYSPSALDLGSMYYWKITEVNEAEAISVWEGAIWSFTTQQYLVVDDFESYNDEDNVIYETWIDGWVNETGSTVGYLSAPFAETTIVNSGDQSMPLSYDNAGVATAEADFSLSQDWTANGIQSLSISFQGAAANSGGQLYVKINGTKVAYDGPGADLTDATWQMWSIDLSTVGNVSSVSSLTIGVEGAGAFGIVYIDDIRLYGKVPEDITGAGDAVQGVPNDGDWPGAETPDLAIDDDTATKFLHFKGETEPTGLQITPAAGATIVSGITFTTANDAPERDPVTFELYGSNDSIDGPYTLIASGDIVDFADATEWPRFTQNETDISFANGVAYAHYQVLFPTVRDAGSANSMQIAEVELLGNVAP
jgi:Concanavalin A-like lectin/glucanases superfamily/F5/8 type C domain